MTGRVVGLRCDGWGPKKYWNIIWWWLGFILWYGEGGGTNFQKSGNRWLLRKWGSQPRLMCLPSKMLLPLKIIERGLKLIPASTRVFCTAAFSRVGVNAATSAFARR